MLSSIINDLKMKYIPGFGRKQLFQVSLGLFDIFSTCQSPSLGKPMNVRIDRKSRNVEGLSHYNAGRFVTDPRKRLKSFKICRDISS